MTKSNSFDTMTFDQWLKSVARARGEVITLVTDARSNPKFKSYTNKQGWVKKYGEAAETAWARFEQFKKRGTQSKGARPPKLAAA